MTIPSTFYFFLNTQIPPFNNELARQAVNTAIDRPALQRLASGFLQAGVLLPPGGHRRAPGQRLPVRRRLTATATSPRPSSSCSSPARPGRTITVWGEQRSPRKQYVEYYTDLLNKIGYQGDAEDHRRRRRTSRRSATRRPTPQTGFADWIQDFPNPADFYLLLDANSIQPVNNENFGNVNDPFIQQQLAKLEPGAGDAAELGRQPSGRRSTSTRPRRPTSSVYGSEQVPKFYQRPDRLRFAPCSTRRT